MIKTIGDLIEKLKEYPQDALIFDMYGDCFEEIIYENEIFLGDSANPNCKTVKGFILQ